MLTQQVDEEIERALLPPSFTSFSVGLATAENPNGRSVDHAVYGLFKAPL